jgi:hypothetical protein
VGELPVAFLQRHHQKETRYSGRRRLGRTNPPERRS